MKYVGIDLHKKTISIWVCDEKRNKLDNKRFACSTPELIVDYFRSLGQFEAVVEATASYEWLVLLIEPYAQRVVLAHPKKLRIIAESTRKSDKIDARVLAEFLAMDMIPDRLSTHASATGASGAGPASLLRATADHLGPHQDSPDLEQLQC